LQLHTERSLDQTFEQAEQSLLEAFKVNTWFQRQHWPENRQRVAWMAADILRRFPDRNAALFEPGCGNGYISYLFVRLGFPVTACDSWELTDPRRSIWQGRRDLFSG
jgi:hypothetical protein